MLPHLSLHIGVPEGEEEPLAVVGPQAVDASGVDGPAQVVVDLLLRVPLFLVPAWADPESEKNHFHLQFFCLSSLIPDEAHFSLFTTSRLYSKLWDVTFKAPKPPSSMKNSKPVAKKASAFYRGRSQIRAYSYWLYANV